MMDQWIYVCKTACEWTNPDGGKVHAKGEILSLTCSGYPPGWSHDRPIWGCPHPFSGLVEAAGDAVEILLIDPDTLPFNRDGLLAIERDTGIWDAKILFDRFEFERVDSFQCIRISLPDGVHAGRAILKEKVASDG